jgi:cell division initiation protein
LKITPIEINKQEFKRSLRGYDPVEVDTFLEMVGKDYEKILDQNSKYQKRIIELETELKNYKEVESTLKQTLMSVQETSDKSLENIKREADLLRKESELKANKMIEDAKRETQKLKEELITLQTQKHSLIARLRHILSSHIELLDVLEVDDFDISKLKDRTKKVFSSSTRYIKRNSKHDSMDQNSDNEEDSEGIDTGDIDYHVDDMKKNE